MNFTEMKNEDLLERIVNLMQSDDSKDSPQDAIQWSKNLFRTRAAAPKKSLVQKVLAHLQMNLSPNKAAFGERSAASGQARQMLFGAGDYQIDLRIAKADKKFNISGQILGENSENAKIELFASEKTFATESNELSEFKFENVTQGNYNLSLTIGSMEILIENIEIQ